MNNLLHIEFDHISSYEVSTLLKFSDDWCNSIIDTKRKMESLLARLLLDRICKKIINKNLAQCTFKKNEFGKPFFEDYPDLYISITHSNGYVCTAVSDSAIGIDFESNKNLLYSFINPLSKTTKSHLIYGFSILQSILVLVPVSNAVLS